MVGFAASMLLYHLQFVGWVDGEIPTNIQKDLEVKKKTKALKITVFLQYFNTFFSVNTAVYVADQYATEICVGFSDRI